MLPDTCTWGISLTLIFLPLAILLRGLSKAWKESSDQTLQIGTIENNSSHLLAYLFATMLPFYRSSLDTWRDLIALATALTIIILVFWHLRLHYVNFFLAALNYRIFTVYPSPNDQTRFGRRSSFIVITKNSFLAENNTIKTKRLTDTVYWESNE